MQRLREKRMCQKEATNVLGDSMRHLKPFLGGYRRDGVHKDFSQSDADGQATIVR
jgi:hypothetical protein